MSGFYVETAYTCEAVKVKISGKPSTTRLYACEDSPNAKGAGHSALTLFANDDTQILETTKRNFDRTKCAAKVENLFDVAGRTLVFGETNREPGHELRTLPMRGIQKANYSTHSMIYALPITLGHNGCGIAAFQ